METAGCKNAKRIQRALAANAARYIAQTSPNWWTAYVKSRKQPYIGLKKETATAASFCLTSYILHTLNIRIFVLRQDSRNHITVIYSADKDMVVTVSKLLFLDETA